MENLNWRELLIEKLKLIFENDKDVISFSVFGSLTNKETVDEWSDIDALLVVENNVDKYFPSIEWAKKIGDIFTYQQSKNSQGGTTKIIFEDFRKIDLIISTKDDVLNEKVSLSSQQIIFSNSDEIKNKITSIENKQVFDIKNYNVESLANEFWFLFYTAITKVVRNDLLIGLHLTLDLYKYCLVLAMWMRDKEAGTNVHRIGGVKNDLISEMNIKIDDLTKKGILELIYRCGKNFDKLALDWSVDYKKRLPAIENLINEATATI